MTRVKMISLNVKGIAQKIKRTNITKMLKQHNPDIIFMQETHSTKHTSNTWGTEMNMHLHLAHGTSSSCGTAIAISKKLNCEVIKETDDKYGRFVMLDVKMSDTIITLINVYAPNNDDPEFFINLFSMLSKHENADIIIGGDFNFVMDTSMDATNKDRKNNYKVERIVKEFMSELMLIDVWRLQNPETLTYTWSKKKPFTASRIDYFLVNHSLTSKIKSSIKPAGFTDHSIISIIIQIESVQRGRGLWKLNNSHLHNIEYVNNINQCIDESLFNESCQLPPERWEIMKENMINKSIKWSKINASKNKKNIKMLVKKLSLFKEKMENCTQEKLRQEYANNYERVKTLYERHQQNIVKGSIVRSRQNWYEEEAKGSKYFLNLEKVRYSNKTMKMLIKDDGTIIREQKKILQEQLKFYRKLYKNDPNVYFNYTNHTDVKLTQEDKDHLDRPISLNELT